MKNMMTKRIFDIDSAKSKLWMTESEVKDIHARGHLVGLHSFSHPMQMSKLSKEAQTVEYRKNYDHLHKVISSPIEVMSHPCGDYDEDTLDILTKMGIKIGFRSNLAITEIKSSLEIPREDHANVFKELCS
jgi:peptidoglycan/xylan/chitin deacetylase (PgdA/CDA1 family)